MKQNGKQQIFFGLLALLTVLSLCAAALAADSGTWGNLKWTIENGVLTISGKGKMQDSSVHGWDSWRMSSSKYKTVIIKSGVTTIGSNCFRNSDFTSVSLPKTITEIGYDAFYWDTKLEKVTIPPKVTRIYDGAFAHCSALKSITVPASVKTIGTDAFGDNKNLREIKVAKANKAYTSVNGVLYTKDKKTLMQYPGGKTGKEFTVPSGVKTIEPWAFSGCAKLKWIRLGSGISAIPSYCFYGCSALTKVSIPAGVTTIENNAFMNCSKLTTVYYAGTEEDRAKMTIENGNDLLLDAKWIYSSKKAEKDLSVSSGTSPEQP